MQFAETLSKQKKKLLRAKSLLAAENMIAKSVVLNTVSKASGNRKLKKSSDILFSVKWWVIDGSWDKIV